MSFSNKRFGGGHDHPAIVCDECGGFGIMFDDVLAGAYATLLLAIAGVWFY